MNRFLAILTPVVFIALLLLVWEIACRQFAIPAYRLPPPTMVWTALVANAPLLLASAWQTLQTALIALVIASAMAMSLALLGGASPTIERALKPLAVAAQVTPVIAIAPLLQIWAGLEHPQRAVIALAVIVAFFPIYSGAAAGLKSADPDLERLFDIYGAKPIQKLLRLRAPSAVPFLLEGHKVAAGLALIGAVVAEFAAGAGGVQGLAWRMVEAGNHLQTDKVFAGLLIMSLMGAGVYAAFELLQRRVLAWWRGR
ncbi:MAG: transporter permease [Caulobacter sp.]|nr:transporter permease [Caulobacter sp.]